MKKVILQTIAYLLFILCVPSITYSNDSSNGSPDKEVILHEKPSEAPDKVEVKPKTRDHEIEDRLESILQATNWFVHPNVDVENGVVFLGGETQSERFKEWAGNLAHNTQDVVAVVNKITVLAPAVWDPQLISQEFLNQGKKIIRALPSIIFGAIILFLAWLAARLVYKLVPILLRDKMNPSLLNQVIAKAIALFVFLLGVYFVFEMADLTTMALTIISGTGILGIILGIAFRDLVENFLASILLSLQSPFETHDLIDLVCPITGYAASGYVERLTMRVTILISLDGNHVQIPNATVYKSNIVNHSSNPIHRESFQLSIGPNSPIVQAVDSALKVLLENEEVLKKPEPLVLVEGLEKENVNLMIHYWIDISKNNPAKVKSSVMRFIKQALQEEGIYQPSHDQVTQQGSSGSKDKSLRYSKAKKTPSEITTEEDRQPEVIEELSPESRQPEKGGNFLGKEPEEDKKTHHPDEKLERD